MGIERPRERRRAIMLVALVIALALCLATLAARPVLERAVRTRIESEASRRGLTARIGAVRVGLWPPLRLSGLTVEKAPGLKLGVDQVDAWWFGHARLAVSQAVLEGPGGLTASAPPSTWDVRGLLGRHPRLMLRQPVAGLVVTHASGPEGGAWSLEARDLALGRLLDVRRLGRPWIDAGTVNGALTLKTSSGVVDFEIAMAARAARLPGLAGDDADRDSLGAPADLSVRAAGTWSGAQGSLEIPRWSATITGAALAGSFALRGLGDDPAVDLALDAERMDFARLLRSSGLEIPKSLCPGTGDGCADDLGAAALSATARGRLEDAASFVVTQKLAYSPPRHVPASIERLRGPFVHEVGVNDSVEGSGAGAGGGAGAARSIDVSPASPDFIALVDVPPLFRRALLLAEDAGFYSHPGIDLREMPAALITDWERGGAARGGSTITQQLAKNLFLSYDKRLGRKLQELPITLLLEAALGKDRILEIYLNVIEWGPDLYGLRPAARAYFGREPKDLTPAQMAFLVALIPGPVKYQVSFAHGAPGPGFRSLIDAVLAKLRSVDALTEEEYQRALAEEIVVQGRPAGPGAAAVTPRSPDLAPPR